MFNLFKRKKQENPMDDDGKFDPVSKLSVILSDLSPIIEKKKEYAIRINPTTTEHDVEIFKENYGSAKKEVGHICGSRYISIWPKDNDRADIVIAKELYDRFQSELPTPFKEKGLQIYLNVPYEKVRQLCEKL